MQSMMTQDMINRINSTHTELCRRKVQSARAIYMVQQKLVIVVRI
jgi:hypothetical protein